MRGDNIIVKKSTQAQNSTYSFKQRLKPATDPGGGGGDRVNIPPKKLYKKT